MRHIWDTIGICLSALCLIHCVALPFLIAFFPYFAPQIFGHENFHIFIIPFIITISLIAFLPGYMSHRSKTPFFIAITAIILISLGVFAGHTSKNVYWENGLTILGSILMITAHIKNRKICGCQTHKK